MIKFKKHLKKNYCKLLKNVNMVIKLFTFTQRIVDRQKWDVFDDFEIMINFFSSFSFFIKSMFINLKIFLSHVYMAVTIIFFTKKDNKMSNIITIWLTIIIDCSY